MTSPQFDMSTELVTAALTSEDFARARERWQQHATRRYWGLIDAARAEPKQPS